MQNPNKVVNSLNSPMLIKVLFGFSFFKRMVSFGAKNVMVQNSSVFYLDKHSLKMK